MDRKLTIVETAALPWWNASAYYAVELSRGLLKKGHRVLFLGIPGSPPFVKAKGYGIEVVEAIDLRRNSPIGFFTNISNLVKLFSRLKPDVINAHQGEGHLLCTLASRMTPGRPVIVRTRADIRRPKTHPFGRLLYEKFTDAIVTSGEFMKCEGYFDGFSLPLEMVHNIYAGVDTDIFRPGREKSVIRKELSIRDDAILFGIIGRLSRVKGHHTFLKAAAKVAQEVDRVNFLIAGEEAQVSRETLINTAIAGRIGRRVHFLGKYPDVKPIIEAIDIGVIASLGSEAVSRAAIEFMAMGKPVISTSVGVLPEIVRDGETGFLLQPGDEDAIARAMLELLNNPGKRDRMGAAGRKHVLERFSLEEMTTRTEQVYFELIDNHRRRV